MKAQFDLVIGDNKFTLTEEVSSHADFFKKFSFYQSLPKVGPNGETDLTLQYRIAQKQYEYFSIVSKKAGMEFKFGQAKDGDGNLFAKGWEPLFNAEGGEQSDEPQNTHTGLAAPKTAAPKTAAPKASGLTAPKAATPAPAPAAAPTPAPSASPQAQQQAAKVLSKFGI